MSCEFINDCPVLWAESRTSQGGLSLEFRASRVDDGRNDDVSFFRLCDEGVECVFTVYAYRDLGEGPPQPAPHAFVISMVYQAQHRGVRSLRYFLATPHFEIRSNDDDLFVECRIGPVKDIDQAIEEIAYHGVSFCGCWWTEGGSNP